MAAVGTVHAVPMPAGPHNNTDNQPSVDVVSGDIGVPILTPIIPIITSTVVTPGNYSSVQYSVPTVPGTIAIPEPVVGNHTGQVPKITGPTNNGTRPASPRLTPASTKTVTVTVPFPTNLPWEVPFPMPNMTIKPDIGHELSSEFSLDQPTTTPDKTEESTITDNTAGYIPTDVPSSALIHDHGRPPVKTSSSDDPTPPAPAEPLAPVFTAAPFRGSPPIVDGNNNSVVESSHEPSAPTATSPFAHELGKPLLNPEPANHSDIDAHQQSVYTPGVIPRPTGVPHEVADRSAIVPYRRWCWRSEIPKGNSTIEDQLKHLLCKDKPIMDSFEDVLGYVRQQEKLAEARKKKETEDDEEESEDEE